MDKNSRGKYFILAVCMILTLLLTACGSTSGKEGMTEQSSASAKINNYAAADYAYDGGSDISIDASELEAAGTTEEAGNSTLLSEDTAAAESGRKLIKNVSLDVETKDFDTFISNLEKEVESFEGYIEYSSVGGSSYLFESSQRTAWYTVRIPEAKLETFISKVGDNGNITNISQNIRDITLEYVDVAGRISTLESELERLNELLSEASSIEDVLAIESKISDVRYELESYQSQMNSYDNQIDYSTVNIKILEVDVVSASQSDSAWEQIQSGFMSSLYGLGQGLSSLVIGLLSAIPYLAVIAAVIVIIVKAAHRRGRKKKERQAEQPKTDETEQ